MSPSASITVRRTKRGERRYVVRYRLGGRETPVAHGGSFRTRAEAEARRRWVSGELAAMRVPRLSQLIVGEGPTVPEVVNDWLRRRVDITDATRSNYLPALVRIAHGLAGVPTDSLTPLQVAEWVSEMVGAGAGRTVIDRCLAALRNALDDYGLEPNPARHRSVRPPRHEREEINPPSHADWQVLLDGVTEKMRLPLRVLEGTGLRVGELIALRLGDLDRSSGRLRVKGGKTRAARRWVPVPEPLMAAMLATAPGQANDPEAAVFPGLLAGSLRMAMRRVSVSAGISLYSPHDLRHRYISLLVRRGVDPAAVSALAGHTRKSLTLDVYTHVLLDEEER